MSLGERGGGRGGDLDVRHRPRVRHEEEITFRHSNDQRLDDLLTRESLPASICINPRRRHRTALLISNHRPPPRLRASASTFHPLLSLSLEPSSRITPSIFLLFFLSLRCLEEERTKRLVESNFDSGSLGMHVFSSHRRERFPVTRIASCAS